MTTTPTPKTPPATPPKANGKAAVPAEPVPAGPSWRDDLIARIKTQAVKSDQQQLILLLESKSKKTAAEKRELEAWIKAEHTRELALTAEAAASRLLGARKDAVRRARNHRLILQGVLLDLAGYPPDLSRVDLLALLLSVKPEAYPRGMTAEQKAQVRQEAADLLARHDREHRRFPDADDVPPLPPGADGVSATPPAKPAPPPAKPAPDAPTTPPAAPAPAPDAPTTPPAAPAPASGDSAKSP